MAKFPERLSSEIETQGINCTMVAEMCGFSVPTVTQWANGSQFAGIKAANLIVLAEKLGVRYAWLLTGEEPKSRQGNVAFVGDPDVYRRLEALERAQAKPAEVVTDEGQRAGDSQN